MREKYPKVAFTLTDWKQAVVFTYISEETPVSVHVPFNFCLVKYLFHWSLCLVWLCVGDRIWAYILAWHGCVNAWGISNPSLYSIYGLSIVSVTWEPCHQSHLENHSNLQDNYYFIWKYRVSNPSIFYGRTECWISHSPRGKIPCLVPCLSIQSNMRLKAEVSSDDLIFDISFAWCRPFAEMSEFAFFCMDKFCWTAVSRSPTIWFHENVNATPMPWPDQFQCSWQVIQFVKCFKILGHAYVSCSILCAEHFNFHHFVQSVSGTVHAIVETHQCPLPCII